MCQFAYLLTYLHFADPRSGPAVARGVVTDQRVLTDRIIRSGISSRGYVSRTGVPSTDDRQTRLAHVGSDTPSNTHRHVRRARSSSRLRPTPENPQRDRRDTPHHTRGVIGDPNNRIRTRIEHHSKVVRSSRTSRSGTPSSEADTSVGAPLRRRSRARRPQTRRAQAAWR